MTGTDELTLAIVAILNICFGKDNLLPLFISGLFLHFKTSKGRRGENTCTALSARVIT